MGRRLGIQVGLGVRRGTDRSTGAIGLARLADGITGNDASRILFVLVSLIKANSRVLKTWETEAIDPAVVSHPRPPEGLDGDPLIALLRNLKGDNESPNPTVSPPLQSQLNPDRPSPSPQP